MVALQQVVVALAQSEKQTAGLTEAQAVRVAVSILLFAVEEAARVLILVVLVRVVVAVAVRVDLLLPTEATARRTQVVVVAGVEATQHRQADKVEAEL